MDVKIIKTKEPLLLVDDVYPVVLPSGITLCHDATFPEGFDLYRVKFKIEGELEYEDVTEEYNGTIAPIWLENFYQGNHLKDIFGSFPLATATDGDNSGKGLTRQELAEIISSIPGDASPSGNISTED